MNNKQKGYLATKENKPYIKAVAKSAQEIGKFEKLELTLDLLANYNNPFDPDEISVTACFIDPQGEKIIVPGFYYQVYSRGMKGENEELLDPVGAACWKVRFSPQRPGMYKYYVTVKDKFDEARSSEDTFQVLDCKKKGFVGVSRVDQRYFEFEDGSPYFAIGHNTCTGATGCVPQLKPEDHTTYKYDRYFTAMGNNGENYTRIWTIGKLGIEWDKLGSYDLKNCWKYDYIVELAERNNIRIMFCFHWFRNLSDITFDYGPKFRKIAVLEGGSPYGLPKGGPCQSMKEFFTNSQAKSCYKKFLRYVVARWGYSTTILSWEFWNEVDAVQDYKPETIRTWTKEMARYLRDIDPWKHLITISFTSRTMDPIMWSLPEIDYVQVHGYWNPTRPKNAILGRDMAAFVLDGIRRAQVFDKPVLFSELGMTAENHSMSPLTEIDSQGLHLHNAIWSSALSGASGTAMLWWWDYVDANNLYTRFKPLAKFIEGVPWTTAKFRKANVKTYTHTMKYAADNVRVVGLQNEELAFLWVQDRRNTWWNRYIHGRDPDLIEDVSMLVSALNKGEYIVEWWDTRTGKVSKKEQITSGDNFVLVSIPSGQTDVACKIFKLK